jgi:5,10-methylenetetrahydrofolate reductase
MGGQRFDVICEIEPATSPDLRRVRHQIGVLSAVSSTFLIPDNHIGRATVSSIAVAHEVIDMGGRAIACLNARDRNTLGFRRDLLTAAAYGVDEFLFVYGDRPESGRRSDDLTVQGMLSEARRFAHQHNGSSSPFRLGVASALAPLPAWKREADFLFAQVSFSIDQIMDWRASVEFRGPVYAGVMVIGSAQMAAKLSQEFPQLSAPGGSPNDWKQTRMRESISPATLFAGSAIQARSTGPTWSRCAATARWPAAWRLFFRGPKSVCCRQNFPAQWGSGHLLH